MSATAATGTYLDRILANTRAEVDARKRARTLDDLERAAANGPEPLPFAARLRVPGVAVIAEIKRASPSRGAIAPGAPAVDVAHDYIAGGAAAISVLTDARYFDGSLDDLAAVSAYARPTATPTLRKDFVIDAWQIAEARAAGAAAVLLIVAALGRERLEALLAETARQRLDALVEVHDQEELETALAAGATLIGVNNRDLRSFAVDLATTERLAALAPPEVTLVGESGVRSRADVERLGAAGAHAVLVGEQLMVAADRQAALRELLG